MNNKIVSILRAFFISGVMLFLSACATTNAMDERDPWEGFNRGVYSFNQTMDRSSGCHETCRIQVKKKKRNKKTCPGIHSAKRKRFLQT